MNAWESLNLKQKSAYFLALSEFAFNKILLHSNSTLLVKEALSLAWEGWDLRAVDCLAFESIVMPPSEDGLYMAFLKTEDPSRRAALMCIMDMVGYVGYYYCVESGIDDMPQSVENVPAVDVLSDFNAFFDQAIPNGSVMRNKLLAILTATDPNSLSRDSITALLSKLLEDSEQTLPE